MTSVAKLAEKMRADELQRLGLSEEQAEQQGIKAGVIAKVEAAPVPVVHLRNDGHLKLHLHYFCRQSRQDACVHYLDASGKQVRSPSHNHVHGLLNLVCKQAQGSACVTNMKICCVPCLVNLAHNGLGT